MWPFNISKKPFVSYRFPILFFLPSISSLERMKWETQVTNWNINPLYHVPLACLSSIPTSVPWTLLMPFLTIFFLLFYIKRWAVENFPSEESSNMRFPLEHSSFVPPSYIFHKYSLSLITEWPWQDLGSENIILYMDLWEYVVDHNTESVSPTV